MKPEDAISWIDTEFNGKSWTSKAKTVGDLMKLVDWQDSVIGRKGTIIPKETDSQEVWDDFYKDTKAKPEEYKELLKGKISDKQLDKFVSALEKTGVSKRQAKELSGALEDTIKNNFTEHYSPDDLKEKIKDLGNPDDLTKKVNDIMGDGWLEGNTAIPNEATISMMKLAKGFADKYAAKTPIEPTAKTTNGKPTADPFAEGFKKGLTNNFGVQ